MSSDISKVQPSININSTRSKIVKLNVGGTAFSTTSDTLLWSPDSFFTKLFSGAFTTTLDEHGAIFIDRDPDAFKCLLSYLRTKKISFVDGVTAHRLREEAEYFNIQSLIQQLDALNHNDDSSCGGLLFSGILGGSGTVVFNNHFIIHHSSDSAGWTLRYTSPTISFTPAEFFQTTAAPASTTTSNTLSTTSSLTTPIPSHRSSLSGPPFSFLSASQPSSPQPTPHASNSSTSASPPAVPTTNSVPSSPPFQPTAHLPTSTPTTQSRRHASQTANTSTSTPSSPNQNRRITFSTVGVGVNVNTGLNGVRPDGTWISNPRDGDVTEGTGKIEVVTISSRLDESIGKMIAIASGSLVRLWAIPDRGEVGKLDLRKPIDSIMFVASSLVVLSMQGRIGFWNGFTQTWSVKDIPKIQCFDASGSLLFLGGQNGKISYIDLEKFPLRLSDDSLLINDFYQSPSPSPITCLSVYLTPFSSASPDTFIELAYGTEDGHVRIVIEHPQSVGRSPKLFQTLHVHPCPVRRVVLGEKNLISVCANQSHVRSWKIVRFRGSLATQPGTIPLVSFKIPTHGFETDIGPFGNNDLPQVFVQPLPLSSTSLIVLEASTGRNERDHPARLGSRARRVLVCGHEDGSVQIWDLVTAFEIMQASGGVGGSGSGGGGGIGGVAGGFGRGGILVSGYSCHQKKSSPTNEELKLVESWEQERKDLIENQKLLVYQIDIFGGGRLARRELQQQQAGGKEQVGQAPATSSTPFSRLLDCWKWITNANMDPKNNNDNDNHDQEARPLLIHNQPPAPIAILDADQVKKGSTISAVKDDSTHTLVENGYVDVDNGGVEDGDIDVTSVDNMEDIGRRSLDGHEGNGSRCRKRRIAGAENLDSSGSN
ncbi:BTB/POZ domain-containing protein kctd3 [Blyttiomyces sp. JEL0837]|nr:BTB/POZ domain-containing protein kctd3 [Blyttiomyces sp. JEL0837]